MEENKCVDLTETDPVRDPKDSGVVAEMTEADARRFHDLINLDKAGKLSPAEQAEIDDLRRRADALLRHKGVVFLSQEAISV